MLQSNKFIFNIYHQVLISFLERYSDEPKCN